MEKLLVKYSEDFGRKGSLDGLFICTKDELNNLNGRMIHFGEVLGKHSEVYSDETYEHCKVLSDDPHLIADLTATLDYNTICGFNPLDYIEECEDQYNQGEEECGNEDCDWCFGETDEDLDE